MQRYIIHCLKILDLINVERQYKSKRWAKTNLGYHVRHQHLSRWLLRNLLPLNWFVIIGLSSVIAQVQTTAYVFSLIVGIVYYVNIIWNNFIYEHLNCFNILCSVYIHVFGDQITPSYICNSVHSVASFIIKSFICLSNKEINNRQMKGGM